MRDFSKKTRRNNITELWQNWWEASTTGRETYRYFPTIQGRGRIRDEWYYYATQYVSCHGDFMAKLNKFKLKEDQWCQKSGIGTDETTSHVIAESRQFEEERVELSELWTDLPPEDRTEAVREDNFKKFVRTARKVGKKKEAEA